MSLRLRGGRGNGGHSAFTPDSTKAYVPGFPTVGLALATWIPRLGRVITVSVMAYVLVAVGWPILLEVLPNLIASRPFYDPSTFQGLSLARPYLGTYVTTEWAAGFSSASYLHATWGAEPLLLRADVFWSVIWIGLHSGLAMTVALATLLTFDRCVGRVTEHRHV
jgi:hypothetical protein